jgi:hypothetical protein
MTGKQLGEAARDGDAAKVSTVLSTHGAQKDGCTWRKWGNTAPRSGRKWACGHHGIAHFENGHAAITAITGGGEAAEGDRGGGETAEGGRGAAERGDGLLQPLEGAHRVAGKSKGKPTQNSGWS